MYRVRYYSEQRHPDEFKGSFLGRLIIVLNWVRWRLETFVQSLVMRWMLKQAPFDKKRESTYRRLFKLDVEAEKLEKERTSPELAHVTTPPGVVDVPARSTRYMYGSYRHVIDDAVAEKDAAEREAQGIASMPLRPQPLDNLIGQYGADASNRRYAKGRRFLTNDEASIEPVAKMISLPVGKA